MRGEYGHAWIESFEEGIESLETDLSPLELPSELAGVGQGGRSS